MEESDVNNPTNNAASRGWFALVGALAATLWAIPPARAMSLETVGPAQTMPQDARPSAAPLALETWSAGSTTLVPLMAVDLQASRPASVDAPADSQGAPVGKPLDDIGFVTRAAEAGRKEVSSARQALPQLKNPDLRQIAEMLVSDHSNANERLSKLAAAKGWPLPGTQAEAPPPSGAASGDFDARWTAEMIAGHEQAVALFSAEAKSGEDQDLRQFARDTLPTIEHHLAALKSLQK
jgi:putative membrane protein